MIAIDSLLNLSSKLIDRLWPNKEEADKAKIRLLELQQSGELAKLEADTSIKTAQAEINKEEAKSGNLFVMGWRPFLGWVSGLALAYTIVLEPFLRFVAKVFFGYTGEFPTIDFSVIRNLIGGILGIGAI